MRQGQREERKEGIGIGRKGERARWGEGGRERWRERRVREGDMKEKNKRMGGERPPGFVPKTGFTAAALPTARASRRPTGTPYRRDRTTFGAPTPSKSSRPCSGAERARGAGGG